MSDEDGKQEQEQGESSEEDYDERELEEERDARLDKQEREKMSAVERSQVGYGFMEERWQMMDLVTRGDEQHAIIPEEVQELSLSATNQGTCIIRNAVPFNTRPAKVDPFKILTLQKL